MGKFPNSIDGKIMKAMMAFAANKNNVHTLLSSPLFYNNKIYVTDTCHGVVFPYDTNDMLDKDKIYTVENTLFSKILVSDEFYLSQDDCELSESNEQKMFVHWSKNKEANDYDFFRDVTDDCMAKSVVENLDAVFYNSTAEPPELHPEIIGVPSDQLKQVAEYAAAIKAPNIGFGLRWRGSIGTYIYTFPRLNDSYVYVCGCIDK